MGLAFMRDPAIGKAALVERLISPINWGAAFKLLRHAVVGNNLWQAVERTLGDGSKYRFITLSLLEAGGPGSGWGYKNVSESEGPFEVNCPVSFFDLVPEPEDAGEYHWRAKVREYHDRQARVRAVQKALGRGSHVMVYGKQYRLESPLYGDTGARIVSWRATQVEDGKAYQVSTRRIRQALTEQLARPAVPMPLQDSLLEAAA